MAESMYGKKIAEKSMHICICGKFEVPLGCPLSAVPNVILPITAAENVSE
jgi:hypothetical protein